MSAGNNRTSLKQRKAELVEAVKPASIGIAKTGPDGQAPGYPKDLPEQSRAKRDEFLYAARDYEADKNYDQAMHYYKKALELDRRNYMVMSNISGILINLGLYEEATKYSRDALGIRKDYVPSLVNLGISLVQSGKIAEGRDYLLKARSLDASNRNANLNLALLYEKIADYGQAQKLYLMLCETEDAQGCLGIGRVMENTGERDEAQKAYRRILALGNADSKAKKLASERLSFLESR
jgi:Tfp pilus assembly protein PilF